MFLVGLSKPLQGLKVLGVLFLDCALVQEHSPQMKISYFATHTNSQPTFASLSVAVPSAWCDCTLGHSRL